MATAYFDFKKFRIYHDHCAMKVGTDGVLLGAWADVACARRVLDIGCGSGVVALIAAQRSQAEVVGIDIDGPSARQAAGNAARSPFSGRIRVETADLRSFCPAGRFDCILSNPPFFEEELLPPSERKAAARHTSLLPFDELLSHAVRLMDEEASLQIILPQNAVRRFSDIASRHRLQLWRRTDVVTRRGKPAKRALLDFRNVKKSSPCWHSTLVLTEEHGEETAAYRELTDELYLKKDTAGKEDNKRHFQST